MKAQTPQEKRELAKHLSQHDPEILDFLKVSHETFGPADGVIYEKYKFPKYPKANIWQLSVYGKRTTYWMKCDL